LRSRAWRSQLNRNAVRRHDEEINVNDQLRHYANKLAYEIDSWDLQAALDAGGQSPSSMHGLLRPSHVSISLALLAFRIGP
jgi:hypothetical protein